jgi:DNA-binding CsgD family transcriptional regulator
MHLHQQESPREVHSQALHEHGPFNACFLGFSLVIALSTSASLFIGSNGGSLPNMGWLSNLVRIVVFLGVALFSQLMTPLSKSPVLLHAAAGCAAFGAGLVTASAYAGSDISTSLYAVGMIVMAAGYSVLYLFWIELYAHMDFLHVVAYFTLVHLVSAAISFVLGIIGEAWFVALSLVVMPVASDILYIVSLQRSEGCPFMQGETTTTGWSFPTRPVVLLASFTLANGFIRHYLSADLKGVALVGVMMAACFALVELGLYAERFDLDRLYALCLPLIVAGSLCVLINVPGFGTAGAILSNAAYTLFSIIVTVLLCHISYRYGVDPLWLFGLSYAAVNLGSLGAIGLEYLADNLQNGSPGLTIVVSIVILVFVALCSSSPNRQALFGSWGIVRTNEKGPVPGSVPKSDETPAERLSRLARMHGLTRREEEVATLLVQDVGFTTIEDVLSITNSTLKTHARHIYAKFGVSGRHELAELVYKDKTHPDENSTAS